MEWHDEVNTPKGASAKAMDLQGDEINSPENKIKKFIEFEKLDTNTTPLLITKAKNSLNPDTINEYKSCWDDLYQFCLLRKDYRSATLLNREMCVQNPLPMKPSTIAEYFQYCCEPAGTKLLEYGNDICSKEDDNKVPIYCTGRWRAPGNLAKCKTAIETIHEKYDLLDDRYKDACNRCIAINMDKTHNFTGCHDHTNGALLRPKGNAMKSPIATEAYDRYFQKLSSEWEVTGNVQLLPDEIRKLQQHLCSDKDIRNLQVYTMILILIKCFLREDEVISIKLDHFDKDFCMVNNGYRVESLCLKVRGKSERERNPVYLLLYRDDEFPEMCPVRHLLVYMACMGHSSGYLFPNKKETEVLRRLQTSSNGNTWKSSDRQAYTHWSYSSWLITHPGNRKPRSQAHAKYYWQL